MLSLSDVCRSAARLVLAVKAVAVTIPAGVAPLQRAKLPLVLPVFAWSGNSALHPYLRVDLLVPR